MEEWKPAYPGQPRPVWTWWDREDSEEGLVGFLTKEDLDRFSRKQPGPYRRVVSDVGKTISQLSTWSDWMAEIKKELGE